MGEESSLVILNLYRYLSLSLYKIFILLSTRTEAAALEAALLVVPALALLRHLGAVVPRVVPAGDALVRRHALACSRGIVESRRFHNHGEGP